MLVGLTGCDCGPSAPLDAGAPEPDGGAGDAGSRCEDGGGSVLGSGSAFGPRDVLVEYYQFCFECPRAIGLSDGGALRPGDGTVGASCTSGMTTSVAPCQIFCCTCPADSTKHFWSQACVNGTCPDEATSCSASFDFAAAIGRPLCR
jgi:hypothetical protein